jgi:hypothetical protein
MNLPHTSPEDDANAMLAAAQALPDVQTAELTNATTVAVLFNDGTSEIIDLLPLNDATNSVSAASYFSSPEVVAPLGTKFAQPRPAEAVLPTGRTAFLSDAVVNDYHVIGLHNPPTNDLEAWLKYAGYTVIKSAGSPENLMKVTGISAMAMNQHGGFGILSTHYASATTGTRTFAIATDLTPIATTISQYLPQIQQDQMGYYLASGYSVDPATGAVTWDLSAFLFITPQFVRNYMTFADNSVLWMNVCSLMKDDAAAQDMVKAFFDKGAGVIFGWTDTASATLAVDSGWFFFDRVLGVNAYGAYKPTPPSPPNRPFNIESVLQEMHSRQHQAAYNPPYFQTFNLSDIPLDTSYFPEEEFDSVTKTLTPGGLTKASLMRQYPSSSVPTIALVPSISGMTLQNNKNQLILTGDFGGTYTNRYVSVGQQQLDATWSNGSITISSLPLSATGPVQVTIDGASSNQVLINEWNNVPLTMTTYNGNDSRTVSCSVNLRTSFDTLRQEPDQAPSASLISTDNAVLQYGQCSFVSSDPAGGDDIPWFNSFAPGAPTVPATGVTVWSVGSTTDGNGGGTLDLSIQAGYCGSQWCFLDTSATKGAGQNLVFDDSAQSLAAGMSTQYGAPGVVMDTLQWAAVTPLYPPDLISRPQVVHPHGP